MWFLLLFILGDVIKCLTHRVSRLGPDWYHNIYTVKRLSGFFEIGMELLNSVFYLEVFEQTATYIGCVLEGNNF